MDVRAKASDSLSLPGKIRRTHGGCGSCKRRSKKCDERKPKCTACERLNLECSFKRDYVFKAVKIHAVGHDGPSQKLGQFSELERVLNDTTPLYIVHFDRWVSHSLPRWSSEIAASYITTPCLRYAMLSLGAAHLAVLEGSIETRKLACNNNHALQGQKFNDIHRRQSQRYLALAEEQLVMSANQNTDASQIGCILLTKVLLAYYHHSATNHLRFRAAVWDSFDFVMSNRDILRSLHDGQQMLQFWYRLYLSSKQSKPPFCPVEGENAGQYIPTFTLPGPEDYIYHVCNINLTSDELIHNILMKTIELRARFIANYCTASILNVSESSPGICQLAQSIVSQVMTGEHDFSTLLSVDAKSSYAAGEHLTDLLRIQRSRLRAWKSIYRSGGSPESTSSSAFNAFSHKANSHNFSTHRNAMNYLYYSLCKLIFWEISDLERSFTEKTGDISHYTRSTQLGRAPETHDIVAICLKEFFEAVDSLDFEQSNLSDTFTFSLTEVLRQLTYSWRSGDIFNHILQRIWPRIENAGPGYEHSHLPAHIAKRWIVFTSTEYSRGRNVVLATSAMPETTPKATLMDVNCVIRTCVYILDRSGNASVEIREI